MNNKEILITSTDGFVGSHLRNYFIEEGWDVYGTVYNLREPLEKECIVNFCIDKDFNKIPNKQFKIIINVAGTVDQTVSKKLMMNINAEGTRRMAEWVKKHNCKHFIQISSIAAYGFRLLGEFKTEKGTKRNKGFFGVRYSKSKAKAERFIEKSGLEGFTLLRFPPILGYADSYISPAIISPLLKGEFYFSGKQDKLYSAFYIKNIGSLISKLIDVGPQNIALNCTDFEMTWKEFVAEYARLLKIDLIDQKKSIWSGILHWSDKKYLLMVSYSRFGAHYPNYTLKQLTGWEPLYSWQEGVKEAIKGYSKNCPKDERKNIKKRLDLD